MERSALIGAYIGLIFTGFDATTLTLAFGVGGMAGAIIWLWLAPAKQPGGSRPSSPSATSSEG